MITFSTLSLSEGTVVMIVLWNVPRKVYGLPVALNFWVVRVANKLHIQYFYWDVLAEQ